MGCTLEEDANGGVVNQVTSLQEEVRQKDARSGPDSTVLYFTLLYGAPTFEWSSAAIGKSSAVDVRTFGL